MEAEKVLVVEDEKDTRFILEKLLSKNKYEVICTTNGAEALACDHFYTTNTQNE